ncbi:hypothetical protein CHS0354_027970 [Potamilus streckersoni]|uniref:G-protein coupled receptors family 1 profile domain-containing protein n=1 Tax=Potamilus streckersoni TaxID=2493646 RepID=A0AAE0T4E9_9BIVA|nr:hypothetical protein CHS0354_027970 [Potamilus streckersoni]
MEEIDDVLEAKKQVCNKTFVNCSDGFAPVDVGKGPSADGPEAVAVPVTFATIFVVGLTGNGIMLFYFLAKKRFKFSHTLYIANLAIADLVMIAVSMPFASIIYTFKEWPYGEVGCKLNEFAQTLSTFVVVMTLTVLSIERYTIIVSNIHRTRKLAAILIICIWIVSCLLALPDLISSRLLKIMGMNMCILYPMAWGQTYPRVHTALKFVLLLVLPLFIIAIFYILIAIKMFTTSSKRISLQESHLLTNGEQSQIGKIGNEEGQHQVKSIQRRKRLAMLVIILVLVFVYCWLPRHIYLLWFHFDQAQYNFVWHVFKIVSYCLMFSNSAINPLVYYFWDKKYRIFINGIFCCKRYRNISSDSEFAGTNNDVTVAMTVFTHEIDTGQPI